ncbi:hypothetical protein D3C76_1573780 [compost metagenome]
MVAGNEITTAVLVAAALARAVFRLSSVTVTVVTLSLDTVAGVRVTGVVPSAISDAAAAGATGVVGVTAPPPPPPPPLLPPFPEFGAGSLIKRNEV